MSNNKPPVNKEQKIKSFCCINEWCRRRFSTKFSMQRHYKTCGVDYERVECGKCKKSLKSIEILEKHQLICYGLAKKVVCQFCDELFCSQFSLRRHLWRFHDDEILPTAQEEQKPRIEKCEKAHAKIYSTDKNILNFALAKANSESKSDYRYYMDVCYDYEYLEGEVDATNFEKATICLVKKEKTELNINT